MDDNLNVEVHFLGCCLLSQDCIDRAVLSGVHQDWFNDRFHQTLWVEMVRASSSGLTPDLVWATDKLGSQCGYRLTQMVADVLAITSFPTYLELLRRNYQRRQFSNTLADVQRQLYNDEPVPLMNTLIEELTRIKCVNQVQDGALDKRISDIIMRDVEISTGYPRLDYMTKGFELSTMWVIGGHTSHGKSMLTANMCLKIAQQGFPVEYISSEMRDEQFYIRVTTQLSGLNRSKIKFDASSYKIYMEKLKEAMALPITFHYANTLAGVRTIIQQKKARVYFVDYLQEIRSDRPVRDRRVEVGEVARALEEMSKYNRLCIVVLSQFHRPFGKDKETSPTIHSFKESGEIENVADIACLLRYMYAEVDLTEEDSDGILLVDKEKEKGEDKILRLTVVKNRMHDHKGMIKLHFDRDKCEIKEVLDERIP